MNNNKLKSKTSENEQNSEQARGKRLLLRFIWASQPISRAELARRIKFNRSSITEIVTPLISKGLIVERPLEKKEFQGLGRPPIGLSFDDTKDFFIGVNLGVSHSQIGHSTLKWDVLESDEFETPREPQDALSLIAEKIKEEWASNENLQLRTIGITVPGPTDIDRRELIYAPHLGWENIAVADFLEDALDLKKAGISIVVENNAAASAMFESRLKLPEDKRLRDYMVVRSGTGIGVGLVFDGELYRGIGVGKGIAGEFGHMTIMAGGKLCVCGNSGCWEQYASAQAATSLYLDNSKKLKTIKTLRFSELAQKALDGERKAQKTLEKIGEYLGIGIANIIMGSGCPNIIVSGRLVYGWEFLRESLYEAINKSLAGRLENWSVTSGKPMGASLGGALEIAVEEFFQGL